jgi:regulator of sirC expression with transglutaminase-like and TPR domain
VSTTGAHAGIDPRARFAELANLRDEEIDLATAALWIAAEEYPELDVAATRDRLDSLAEEARAGIEAAEATEARVDALNQFVFEQAGFHGNQTEYYDPRNSYLNDVLELRRGIPITLAIVYVTLGEQLGLDVRGVSFPGHFLVKCVAEDDIVIDPFAGCRLSHETCEARLQRAVGRAIAFEPALHLRAATHREILVRVLSNLKQIFAQQRDFGRTLACCDRILLLEPDAPLELRDRALVYEQLDCTAAAAADLDRFLQLAPDDPTSEPMRERRDALRTRTGRLH